MSRMSELDAETNSAPRNWPAGEPDWPSSAPEPPRPSRVEDHIDAIRAQYTIANTERARMQATIDELTATCAHVLSSLATRPDDEFWSLKSDLRRAIKRAKGE